MDETSIRSGRVGPGKMRTARFRPVFGDRDEIAFPFRLVPRERCRSRPARRLRGRAALGRKPSLRRLLGIPKRSGSALRLPVARPARVGKGEGFRAGACRRGPGAGRRLATLRKENPDKEARGPEKHEFRRSRALPVAEAFGSCHSAGRTGSSAGRGSGRKAVGTVQSPVAAHRLRGIDPRACPEDAPGESRSIPRAASRSPRREDGRICSPAIRRPRTSEPESRAALPNCPAQTESQGNPT